jgi:hypothetical protein
MLTDTKQKSPAKSALKNPLLYSTVVLGIALLVVLWILFSRWQQNHSIERRAREENARKQMESDRTALEQLGGNNLAIQSFYASPGAIHKGESAQLCYGVANAKSVKLEPQPNEVWPSHARCVSVSLQKTTTYTLTISDAAGETQIQSLQVRVE